MNIAEIEMELSDLVNENFDPDTFIYRFLEIYKAPKSTLDKFRKGTQNKADIDRDLLWQRKIYFRPMQNGDTAKALDEIKTLKVIKTHKPRLILVTDGKEVSALDLKTDDHLHCDFIKLNNKFQFFYPLANMEKYQAVEENTDDVKAAGRLAKFHDEIMQVNAGWHTPEKRHALNQFMTRVLFCLFSEDTGSFKEDLFVQTVSDYGGDNGEYIQDLLTQLFNVMNTSKEKRGNIPAHIAAFPYVNGGLFADKTEVPKFSKRAKRLLIEAARLDWREINPDIFGSMIQAVVDTDMRGDLGMHYTSVPNIMKVLHPLFLMSLEEEFEEARGRRDERARLQKLLTRISKIRVFDPACGSGNFLIIAYRELRKLEMRIFQREDDLDGGTIRNRYETHVKISNFYGIELADFAAETAKLSLWIAEYQMNQRFKNLFGEMPDPFPLNEGGHITRGNALRENWEEICRPVHDPEIETYIVGNPPYLGYAWQNKEQKEDLKIVFSSITKNYKNLDYVAAWYMKGSQYCAKHQAECAFVATNSICQGEQVALLWPLLFKTGLEIGFAHQSFIWRNLATNNAGVTCVIVGIRPISDDKKILFHSDISRYVSNIGAYLIEMSDTIIKKVSNPLNKLPKMILGNIPVDGGHLILSTEEKNDLLQQYPEANHIVRRFYGSQELIKGIERWCLWISDDNLPLAQSIPPISERIIKVQKMRLNSSKAATIEAAKIPYKFGEVRHTNSQYVLVIPRVSSENRPYLPVDLLTNNPIIQNKAFAIYDGEPWVLAIIASRLHQQWIATVCVRLRSDFSYSNTLGYNTFPLPSLTKENKEELENHAWNILGIRQSYTGKTIAWLYDNKTMPSDLLAAHKTLDDCLEKIYIGRPFKDDTERLEHLFKMYEKMTAKKK